MPRKMNKQNIEIKSNNKLSPIDKAFMIVNYPFPPSRKPRDPTWSFTHALDVAGVNDDCRVEILKQHQGSDWKELRFLFTLSCTMTHARNLQDLDVLETGGDWCLGEFDSDPSSGVEGGSKSTRGVATRYCNLWLPGDCIMYTFLQEEDEATPY